MQKRKAAQKYLRQLFFCGGFQVCKNICKNIRENSCIFLDLRYAIKMTVYYYIQGEGL